MVPRVLAYACISGALLGFDVLAFAKPVSFAELNSMPEMLVDEMVALAPAKYSQEHEKMVQENADAEIATAPIEIVPAPVVLTMSEIVRVQDVQNFVGHKPLPHEVEPPKPMQVAQLTKSAPAIPKAEEANPDVLVTFDEAATIEPKALRFERVGDRKVMKIVSKRANYIDQSSGFEFFVRDPNLLHWDRAKLELQAEAAGSTEIYLTYNGKLHILPVEIKGTSTTLPPTLKVPESLTSLKGLMPNSVNRYASYPVQTQDDDEGASEQPAAPKNPDEQQEAEEETGDEQPSQFAFSDRRVGYQDIQLRVVDERSNASENKLFPVSGVVAQVIGTKFKSVTSSAGLAQVSDLPMNSRFLVRLSDPNGIILPTIFELQTDESQQKKTHTVMVMRTDIRSAYEEIVHTTQLAGLGSVCGIIYNPNNPNVPMADVSVRADIAVDGPYYVNTFGFIDPSMRQTSANGRFCIFNVDPGPVSLSVFSGDNFVRNYPTISYAGTHQEIEVDLADPGRILVNLAVEPTAHEQLSTVGSALSAWRTIDVIDLIPIGSDEQMVYEGPGILALNEGGYLTDGRFKMISQAAEFETTLYDIAPDSRQAAVPLIPRGFIEDLAVYGQISYDSSLGSVLVEYPRQARDAKSQVSIKLIDSDNQPAGDGWYFSDDPIVKGIFFNVPPGRYSIVIETGEGFWLAAESTIVFSETLSYVSPGNIPVKLNPAQVTQN